MHGVKRGIENVRAHHGIAGAGLDHAPERQQLALRPRGRHIHEARVRVPCRAAVPGKMLRATHQATGTVRLGIGNRVPRHRLGV